MTASKKLMSAVGSANEPVYVDSLFSTYLYTGNSSTQTITNGIDLAGEGGMVWIKRRNLAEDNNIWDTERGVSSDLVTNKTAAAGSSSLFTSFDAGGFTLSSGNARTNISGSDYTSWTFRKAPKFFDVVTYTGDGTNGRSIAHNLGCDVGAIIVKNLDAAENWAVYHKSTGNSVYLRLNTTDGTNAGTQWASTTPTSTDFYVSNTWETNVSGYNYVAYLFAHNNGDGEFGENGDEDIIKCGSFTTNGTITLGWEPQWLMFKATGTTSNWEIIDNMRGLTADSSADNTLDANSSAAEDTGTDRVRDFGATSFTTNFGFAGIYIAIRRPHKPAESGSEVFSVDLGSDNSFIPLPHVVDAFIDGDRNGNTYNFTFASRLTGRGGLFTSSTAAESSNWLGTSPFDYNNGIYPQVYAAGAGIQWAFKRSKGFFDVVCYTGDGVAGRTVNHNLGVAPEMMIVKSRTTAQNWTVYHSGIDVNSDGLPETDGILLNQTGAAFDNNTLWNDTAPTASVFSVGTAITTNDSSQNFIAYLFATQAGISKVGSYTGNGTSQTIDCGFTTGARFVLIKSTTQVSDWNVYDTSRGIVAGNDAELNLNSTSAENTNTDYIDPDPSGFIIPTSTQNSVGHEYIYLAIA